MKEIKILGSNRFEAYSKTREACRAVIMRGKELLLTHDLQTDCYMLPGGGMEGNETREQCCIREVEEETGYIVRPLRQFATVHEYYEEYRYSSYYFVCAIETLGQVRLTEAEQKRGLKAEWIPMKTAIAFFSKHQQYAAVSEEKRGIYLREYQALLACIEEHESLP
ncbi:MAG: NUDIX domain-containing protein [Clostridia bacterium]|nr:NUDIX domain-containing protein [Clostridia bacterium]